MVFTVTNPAYLKLPYGKRPDSGPITQYWISIKMKETKDAIMRQREKEETALFYIGWSLLFIGGILWLMYQLFPVPFSTLLLPCLVNSTLGLYCPGCGGTRAVAALLHGDLVTSFICHPLVPYTAIGGGWFLLSQSVERISRHKIKIGLKYRDGYIWAALGILIINFIIKNLLLIIWDIDLLKGITSNLS